MYQFNCLTFTVCNRGSYISNGSCVKCPGICKDDAPCNTSTGMCDDGCSMHRTGKYCESTCISKLSIHIK